MPFANSSQVKKLIQVFRFERSEILAIYFYAILAGGIHLTLPLGIQSIISFVQAGAVSTSLILLILLVIIGVALTGLFQVNVMKIIEKIQQELFVRYSFGYAEAIPILGADPEKQAELPKTTNHFFDIASLQKGIGKILLDVPAACIQILAGLLLLSFYHPAFIAFAALLIIVLLLIFRYSGATGLQSSMEESDFKYKLGAQLQELAYDAGNERNLTIEARHLRNSDSYVFGYLDARTRHFHVLKLQYWTLIIFKLFITAGMLIMGAVLLLNQQLSIGQFIAVEIVILLVIASVEKLIINLDNVYDVLTSVEKLSKLLEQASINPTQESVVTAG